MNPVVFAELRPEPAIDRPRPERLLSGNPLRSTASYYASADGVVDCGIWTCERGAWRIQFADTKDEFFCVLSGRVRLHNADGATWDLAAGEAAVIPAGFGGVFEVLEPVRKYYVVIERAGAT